ncbi:formate/nitrite transporter family protein [Vagococcus sp. DIV0080]|uniref:Formate/nitrite transporter family protein n=1 Tax=Candidatus Vagococcus giribetii TaxID=2230876 RepID=A0ABS3HR39_9ENTE|nr:formate/nitrite transporter family protein [Vagococcus sp. DIV0080]MBO0475653.1 formate/nitrite transporter family protein [Vagococcus sp. DIV0080]
MKEKNYLIPSEIAEKTIEIGIKKVKTPVIHLLVLGFLAGAFIAFASEGSNMAAYNLLAQSESYGLGKALAGAIFGTGLMLVVLAGGELFTGNTLILLSVLDKKVTWVEMCRNWLVVYLGNLLGSLFIVFLIIESGQLSSSENLLGAMTIKIAIGKVKLSFLQGIVLGIMCNWLVCLAVWLAYGALDMTGKIVAIFFPIWLFITSGFEHSIANMYYIPVGILAKQQSSYYEKALSLGVSKDTLDSLNWQSFFLRNLLPVTIGNIIGGTVFVALIYWFVYKKRTMAKKEVLK